mgnify:CR=1 FL=1
MAQIKSGLGKNFLRRFLLSLIQPYPLSFVAILTRSSIRTVIVLVVTQSLFGHTTGLLLSLPW